MSNFSISHKLTCGIFGGLCLFFELIPPLNATIVSNPHQPVSNRLTTTTNSNYIALSWSEIWQKLQRQKVAGGSRGMVNDLCLIAPSILVDLESSDRNITQAVEIWHQNPLFIWQSGELNKIVLRNETGFYWEKVIEPSSNHLFYDGKPLELGESYQVVLFAPFETEIYQIQIVTHDKYQQIEADLTETKFETKSANPEEIALAKADYFAQRQMWLDVLWELYSIPHPTEELKSTLEQIKTHNFCDSSVNFLYLNN